MITNILILNNNSNRMLIAGVDFDSLYLIYFWYVICNKIQDNVYL